YSASRNTKPNDALGRDIDVWVKARGESDFYPPELWYKLDQTETIQLYADLGRPADNQFERLNLPITTHGGVPHAIGSLHFTGNGGFQQDELLEFATRAAVFRPEDARNPAIERQLWQKIIGPRHDRALREACNTIFGQNAESYSVLPDG